MLPLLPHLFLCALPPSGGFAVFVTDTSGLGTVRKCTLDASNNTTYTTDPLLTNIQLLECVPAGRTPLEESLGGRAQLRSDLGQGTRVQLPAGKGSVYHYSRSDGESTNYGFFLIDSDGGARVLIELPAAPGPTDPFLSSVACDRSGTNMLVATRLDADGDLWQLYTDGCTDALNRTGGVDAQEFGRDSFFLSSDLGAAVTTTGVLRFDPHSNGCTQVVDFDSGSTPPWLDLALVPSLNGRWVAFLAGDSTVQLRPYVMGESGDVSCMNDQADFIPGAGFLPEAQDGPWLAVSDDGKQCAWRVGEVQSYQFSFELYMAVRTSPGPMLSLQVTQPSLFEDYIDEIGLVIFRPGPSGPQLLFMAGDAGSDGSLLSRADLFSATLDENDGSLQAANLSLTSGDPSPPFLNYGTLEPVRVRLRPNSGRAMIYSRETGSHHLLFADFGTLGVEVVQDGVEGVSLIDTDDGDWMVAMEQVQGGCGPTGLCTVETDGSNPEVDLRLPLPTLGGATRIQRDTRDQSQDQNWYACICAEGSVEHAWQVDVNHSNTIRSFTTRDLQYGPSMGYTSDGALILSFAAGNSGCLFAVWPQTGPPLKVGWAPLFGFVLPGA